MLEVAPPAPVTGQGSAPYHEPVTGGAYGGYVGMIGDFDQIDASHIK